MIDENGRAYFTYQSTNRWFGMQLDMLAFGYISFNLVFALALNFWLKLDSALVGMSISVTIELSGAFQYMVRQMIEI